MKWSTGLVLSMVLACGASVSQGGWMMRIHQGATVEEWAMADIDSLTFYDATGSCCELDGTCTVTTQAACTGTWTMGGVCTPNPCTPPPGMVFVPAGTFIMGSPADEPGRNSDETQHQVTLTRSMYVSTYEVTQSEWLAVMGWNESGGPIAYRPVVVVTWYDAVSYCNQRSTGDGYTPAYLITNVTYSGNHITSASVTWKQAADGYRLLTEAEWEYACRATSTSPFCNGGITYLECLPLDPNLDQVGWYCGNDSSTSHDVGSKIANLWGLSDLHGNVFEWCWDWYGAYSGNTTDPTGPASGAYRVYRGGGWSYTARYCRSADRNGMVPWSTSAVLGLRLARTTP